MVLSALLTARAGRRALPKGHRQILACLIAVLRGPPCLEDVENNDFILIIARWPECQVPGKAQSHDSK
jgi:predicted RNA polymerase sigma factor